MLQMIVVAFVYILCIFLNDGFMATDEYFTGITRYVPAQTSDVYHLVNADDVKSPLQILPMHAFAQLALKLGVTHPYWQYRFSFSILAIINVLILGWVFLNYPGPTNDKIRSVRFLIFGFFFLAPFAFTRPMFESLAAPWVALSALFASRYDQLEFRKDLLLSVIFISIAFMMRQQVGICALALVMLPLFKKRPKDFVSVCIIGLLTFVILGVPDYFLRGGFHYSLFAILKYNIAYGSSYATHPIYTYPVLIFFLCFGPWWIMKFPAGFWKNHFRSYRVEWLMLGLFVVLHSSFPQKWERFLISMIPLFIILLSPLFLLLWEDAKTRRFRLGTLIAFNLILFIPATFFPPQKNLIELSQYIDQHPEINTVIRVNNTPEWITDAFIKNPKFNFRDVSEKDLSALAPDYCSDILVISRSLANKVNLEFWTFEAKLNVNAIEEIAFKLNPTKNVRRAPLMIFKGKNNCLKYQK
jgi:hypothetical protein